jgi:hypothetical protein
MPWADENEPIRVPKAKLLVHYSRGLPLQDRNFVMFCVIFAVIAALSASVKQIYWFVD